MWSGRHSEVRDFKSSNLISDGNGGEEFFVTYSPFFSKFEIFQKKVSKLKKTNEI
jgi:hypothetical protein